MCLIITSQTGSLPVMGDVLSGWADNPHSWGLMTVHNRSVVVSKGFTTASLIDSIERLSGYPWALHFRYATHGKIDTVNAHPFKLRKNLHMMHNGIIKIDRSSDSSKSDTWHYAQHLKHGGISASCMDLARISSEIGANNKMVFMDSHGSISIVNEGSGIWQGDQWYSSIDSLPIIKPWQKMESWTQCCLCNRYCDPPPVKDDDYLCSDCVEWGSYYAEFRQR